MAVGDITGARRFYELAASAGSAGAAAAVGQTLDPVYLREAGVRGMSGNRALAIQWYEKARKLGDMQAQSRLDRLLEEPAGTHR
jgi:TPR repeat protein